MIWVSDRSGTDGFFIVVVPKSVASPHAVNAKGLWLFPKRRSAGVVALDEAEVADEYRQRFARLDDRAGRLADMRTASGVDSGHSTPGPCLWLTVCSAPLDVGDFRIDQANADLVKMNWSKWGDLFAFGGAGLFDVNSVSFARRRLQLRGLSTGSRGPAVNVVNGELHSDGCGWTREMLPSDPAPYGLSDGSRSSPVAVEQANSTSNCVSQRPRGRSPDFLLTTSHKDATPTPASDLRPARSAEAQTTSLMLGDRADAPGREFVRTIGTLCRELVQCLGVSATPHFGANDAVWPTGWGMHLRPSLLAWMKATEIVADGAQSADW